MYFTVLGSSSIMVSPRLHPAVPQKLREVTPVCVWKFINFVSVVVFSTQTPRGLTEWDEFSE